MFVESRERARAPIDWPAIVGGVAVTLLGEPTKRTKRELRFGRRCSLSVDLVRGRWFDHEAGEGGGVFKLVMRERGSQAAALEWLVAEGFIPERGPSRPVLTRCGGPRAVETGNPADAETHAAEDADREASRHFDGARRIWKATSPLAGTIAEAYFVARGVGHVVGAPALRYHPRLSHPTATGQLPGMVAGVQAVDGSFLGIQRTFLDGSRKESVSSRQCPNHARNLTSDTRATEAA